MAVEQDVPISVMTFFALLAVFAASFVAYLGSSVVLSKQSSSWERFTFIWLAFDGLIHLTIEGPFLWLSLGGRTINTSSGILADMWREYARADARWGTADPTIVSLEVLTVLGGGPMCLYILYLLMKKDPSRHYWIVVLSTAELYGGWMTFGPEWLTGSKALDTTNWLDLWIMLIFLNILWVGIPIALMIDSYSHIAKSLRATQKIQQQIKSR